MRTVHLETSLPGVFAAGDVRYGSVKRVASAVGEEANAVELLHRYLAEPVPCEPRLTHPVPRNKTSEIRIEVLIDHTDGGELPW